MPIIDGHIRCSGCGELKSLDAFAPSFAKRGHATGAIRGVLCNRCNAGIAHLGDNIDGVRRAVAYLERAQQHPPFKEAPTMRINLLSGAN